MHLLIATEKDLGTRNTTLLVMVRLLPLTYILKSAWTHRPVKVLLRGS